MAARRFVADKIKHVLGLIFRGMTKGWIPFSKLFLVSDSPNWSISHDMKELANIASQIGVATSISSLWQYASSQSVFFGSHFDLLLRGGLPKGNHHLGTAYFHGRPGTGVREFDEAFAELCKSHERVDRIQVSCKGMKEVVLSSGIAAEKVFLIPIGINIGYFRMQTPWTRSLARKKYSIPESAFVVGSFQKDGVGWDEGLEPKLIKGPDIFLKAIGVLKRSIPTLFVFLSGPARGYVKRGLEEMGVPYGHSYEAAYSGLGNMYQALDLYIVASREEGGPKSILESMASGVPLVTTRVGQAVDLVRHEDNGWIVDVEDYEGLASWGEQVVSRSGHLGNILASARKMAEANAYSTQLPLWREFMKGFVEPTL